MVLFSLQVVSPCLLAPVWFDSKENGGGDDLSLFVLNFHAVVKVSLIRRYGHGVDSGELSKESGRFLRAETPGFSG